MNCNTHSVLSWSILFLVLTCSLGAQHADIEGDTRIVGKLNIINAVGDSNVYIGANAGIGTMGYTVLNNYANTFVGQNAGKSNYSGSDNTFVGHNSGTMNDRSDENSFFGSWSGYSNYSGDENSFFGSNSGYENINGDGNSFFGSDSGEDCIDGSYNSFFGIDSGEDFESGEYNSFFGALSGEDIYYGDDNVIIGHEAGLGFDTGYFNTHIGSFTGLSTNNIDTLYRTIAIGYRAEVGCNNCAVIGGTGENAVNVGIGTKNPTTDLDVRGDGSFFDLFASEITTNDATFTTVDVNSVMKLKPLTVEPFICKAGTRGSIYYDNNDKLKVCTHDGSDYEWLTVSLE